MAEFVTREELNRVINEYELHNKITEAESLRRTESIDRWRAQVEAKQQKHDKFLYGNGEPGMDEVLRNTNREIGSITKTMTDFIAQEEIVRASHRSERNQYRFLTYAAIVSLIAQVIIKIFFK